MRCVPEECAEPGEGYDCVSPQGERQGVADEAEPRRPVSVLDPPHDGDDRQEYETCRPDRKQYKHVVADVHVSVVRRGQNGTARAGTWCRHESDDGSEHAGEVQ